MEIALLPKQKSKAPREDYREQVNEFSAFVDIVLKEEKFNTKGLKFLKYSIAASKLAIQLDGNTTY